jgi:type I restriction enzyme M protein
MPGQTLDRYRLMLRLLGSAANPVVATIFADAQTAIRQDHVLAMLVADISNLNLSDLQADALGDAYEGVLERSASDAKSGAGQYFTPRPLVESLVAIMQPQPGEVVQDPAAGTGGFLVSAARRMRALPGQSQSAHITGVELVPETHRLLLMHTLLHGIDGDFKLGDTLSPLGSTLLPADLVLSNPPFGTKSGGGLPTRTDLPIPTANKQLAFIQHIVGNLRPGGRAAIVVPDNVLYGGGDALRVRRDVLRRCRLHTILRLPNRIFYAPDVRTSVLFLQRGRDGEVGEHTEAVWVYDLRSAMPTFGKRQPLHRDHFREFELAYGGDPNGTAPRVDEGPQGRFRRFTRADIAARDDRLDIDWLDAKPQVQDPAHLLAELGGLVANLRQTADDLEAVRRELVP